MGFNLADYEPVEERLSKFWTDHPKGRIVTKLLSSDDGVYVVQASVWRDETADEIMPSATGLARDTEAQLPGQMKASALEVCETSAIGRALANLGYAPKGQRPSREEMQKASEAGRLTGGKDRPASASQSGAGAGKVPASDPSSAGQQGKGDEGRKVPSPAGQAGDGQGLPSGEEAASARPSGHVHEWADSPNPKLTKILICTVSGCLETMRRPSP